MTENPEHRLDEPENISDDEAVREYGRQKAIDALLCDAMKNEPSDSVVQLEQSRKNKIIPLATWAGLAACVVALLGIYLWNNDRPNMTSTEQVSLDARWQLEAGAGAEYSIIEPNLVRLNRGELRFISSQPASLVVETPNGVAKADGTDFFIGHHPESTHQPTETNTTMKTNKLTEITRILVMTGMVTLVTDQGSVSAAENEAAVMKKGSAPEKIAVRANSKFATELYTQLAKENPGENLFFSPYSISTALMMAAEGARGKTAQEMGNVLGFPESLRRVGDDAQKIPWEMSRMHTGLATLQHLFNLGKETVEQKALRKKLDDLKKRLSETRKIKANLGRRSGRGVTYNKEEMKAYRKQREIEKSLAQEIHVLQKKVAPLELKVANALWAEKSYPFLESYIKTINGNYETEGFRMADFKNDPGAERKRINSWVEDQTKDRIKNLMPEDSVTALTRLVIVNAIYFKGDWETPFKSQYTEEKDFTLATGQTTKVQLMQARHLRGLGYAAFNSDASLFATPVTIKSGQTEGLYPEKDGFSMVELPYRGGDVSMVVIAPNSSDRLGAIESKLNRGNLSAWIKQMNKRKVHVSLPKFRSETTYDLNGTLSALGMPTAFKDPSRSGGADFGGLSDVTDPLQKLCINKVIHKAFVEVNEEGTEAAAATGISKDKKSEEPISIPFTPHFRADRPFIYLIRDNQTGSILFLGRMMNPNS